MHLKRAILEAMGRDALKDAIVRFDLADGVDRRSPDAMRSRLAAARRATPKKLLSRLRVADVKRVCESQGVDATARGKQVLVERLLDGGARPRSRKPPSASKDPHAAGREPRAASDGPPEPSSKTRKRQPKPSTSGSGVTTGYETELWDAANALRGNMDAAEYKHVVLGLIFLKYISDAFEERHGQLEAERDEGADPEDPDFYIGANVFWVPPEARWRHLQALARQPAIGKGRGRCHGWPSSATTRASTTCCRRATPARRSTSAASAN